jgi:hypothetical protein
MTKRIVDIRNRPAFLHDFYGARQGTPEFDTAKWLNGRTGSEVLNTSFDLKPGMVISMRFVTLETLSLS